MGKMARRQGRRSRKGRQAMMRIEHVAPVTMKDMNGDSMKKQLAGQIVDWVMDQKEFLKSLISDPAFVGEQQGWDGIVVVSSAVNQVNNAPDAGPIDVEGDTHTRLLRALKNPKNPWAPVVLMNLLSMGQALVDAKEAPKPATPEPAAG